MPKVKKPYWQAALDEALQHYYAWKITRKPSLDPHSMLLILEEAGSVQGYIDSLKKDSPERAVVKIFLHGKNIQAIIADPTFARMNIPDSTFYRWINGDARHVGFLDVMYGEFLRINSNFCSQCEAKKQRGGKHLSCPYPLHGSDCYHKWGMTEINLRQAV